MSLRKEQLKCFLMERGLPEWQADMIAGEAEAGGMSGAIADARIFANVHNSRGVIPEREPTARERAQGDAQARARRETEAKAEAERVRARALEDEWRQRR